MTDQRRFDMIYLNKRGVQTTNDWAYYRLTSIGGQDRDPIEACLITWPEFKDIDSLADTSTASVWTPGLTGLQGAFATLEEFLKIRWNIEHESSVVIGIRARGQED